MRSPRPAAEERSERRIVPFLAHVLTHVLRVTFVVLVASGFGLVSYLDHPAVAALAVCWFASIAHRDSGQLCRRCLDSVPADAPRRAEGCWLPLKVAHFTGTAAGMSATVAVCMAPLVAMAMTSAATAGRVFMVAHMWVFTAIYADWIHSRLRCWCPFCPRWDDRGDDEPSPDPARHATTRRGPQS